MAERDPTRELIDRLVAHTEPVRRLWAPPVRFAGWTASVLVVAVALTMAGLRPDVSLQLTRLTFVGEIAVLAMAALAAGWLALRGAVPGLEDRRVRVALGASLAASVAALVAHAAGDAGLPAPIDAAVGCAECTALLAVVPWLGLAWAIWRGAPLDATRTWACAGLAAWTAAYLLMRLRCPVDQFGHLALGHALPLVAGVLVSVVVGLANGRRWSTPRRV